MLMAGSVISMSRALFIYLINRDSSIGAYSLPHSLPEAL